MENGWYTWNLRSKTSFICCLLLVLVSCTTPQKQKSTSNIPNQDQLETGMLICRLGNGYFSNYFRKYASKEQKYSHIGILSKENNTLYVYHSEASELTGVGQVKKDKLSFFLQGIKTYTFFKFDYTDLQKENIIQNVQFYYAQQTPFDLAFNKENDKELYCTELIATSINKALQRKEINASLNLKGKILYGLDDIYLNKHIREINLTKNTHNKTKTF